MPPSRTQHNVSNVEVLDGPEEGSARVLSNLMLVELRAGGDGQVGTSRLRLLAARCQYLFVNGPDWRIREKKLVLIDRDLPHHNLSFIL
jgi:3-phenylpropionate/cinnamic acid dioxygenase small subunit